MKRFYLFGASGHGKVIAEIAELNSIKISAFIDNDNDKNKFLDHSVIHEMPNSSAELIISVGDNLIRKKIAEAHSKFSFSILKHPYSFISKRSKIDKGTVIMAGVTINSFVEIGKHAIINTNSTIDHDCVLEDYVHISPNAALAGNVTVGEGSHIGIGSCIIQGIKIGKWCTIGAGSVIIKDVPDGATVVGNPGRIIKHK